MGSLTNGEQDCVHCSYAHCVDAGTCEPPLTIAADPPRPSWRDDSQQRLAAVVDLDRAETFCAWRGGRLPSLAESARASHADAANVCLPALYDAWLACHFEGFDSEPCRTGSPDLQCMVEF